MDHIHRAIKRHYDMNIQLHKMASFFASSRNFKFSVMAAILDNTGTVVERHHDMNKQLHKKVMSQNKIRLKLASFLPFQDFFYFQ